MKRFIPAAGLALSIALGCGGLGSEPVPPVPPTPPTPPTPSTPPTPPTAASDGLPADFCGPSSWLGSASAAERAVRADAWRLRAAWPDATICEADAWVSDPDPAGLNVRAAPSADAAIVDTLPQSTEIRAVAARGGWLLLCQGSHFEGGPQLAAAGWVHGSKLATATRGYEEGAVSLLAAPQEGAALAARVPSEATVTASSCAGSWWRVRHEGREGWLKPEDNCPAAITTCP